MTSGKGRSEGKSAVDGMLTFDYSTVVASLSAVKKEERLEEKDGSTAEIISDESLGLGQTGYGAESLQLDHTKLWYGEQKQKGVEGDEELYKKGNDTSDVTQMMLSVPEAEETLKDIQYATALGAYHDVDVKTREKFSLWVMFNPALLGLFEATYKITGNVDYSKVV